MLLLRCGCPHSGTIIVSPKKKMPVCTAREVLTDNHNISNHMSAALSWVFLLAAPILQVKI